MVNNNVNDLFSMSKMLDSLPKLRLPTARDPPREDTPAIPPSRCGVSNVIPPPGFTLAPRETYVTKQNQPQIHPHPYGLCTASNPQQLAYRLHWIFDFMTNTKHDLAQLNETISKLDRGELHKMVSLMTSDSYYFLDVASNEQGSKRMQKILGKSDDVYALFCTAIVRLFPYIMTDKNTSHVVVRAMRILDGEKKEYMCKLILRYVLLLACDQHGCVALNEIITDLDNPYYRNQLLGVVMDNALFLSNDAYGNFVIQQVLKLNDLCYTQNIAVRLCGHFVDLSFQKRGSYIVERLLERDDSMVMVVEELLKCENDKLVRLARSDYGNFVVCKALEVTKKGNVTASLFRGLGHKLTPFSHLLRRSRGNKIATILDSIC